MLLSGISVGTTIGRPPGIKLTPIGRVVQDAIDRIPEHDPMANADASVLMPNHIHMILFLHPEDGRALLVPTVSRIIQQMKGYVTKRIGYPKWQARFYDNVIRSERDYRKIWQYIDDNPAHWSEDRYYVG